MVPIEHLRTAELRLRALCDEGALPQPDEIRYGETSLYCLWHDLTVAIVVDCDGMPADAFGPSPVMN